MGFLDSLLGASERRFARLVIEGLRQAGELRAIRYEKARFRLLIDDKPLPLSRFYADYRAAARTGRDAVIRRAVHSWGLEAPKPAFALDRLLPAVWARSLVDMAALREEHNVLTCPWPHRILGEHLAIVLVLGAASDAQPMRSDELKACGLDVASAWEQAYSNLRQRPPPSIQFSKDGVYRLETDDAVAAAQGFLVDRRLGRISPDNFLLAAPRAELAFVVDANEPAAVQALAQQARSAFDAPQSLTGYVFRQTQGKWRCWLPERGHPAYKPLKLLQMESQARDYAQQKRLLDELGRKADNPLCLASFSALEDEQTGEPRSFTVWPEGLEILLPQTDEVLFFQPNAAGDAGEVIARGSWEQVQRAAGDLMERLELYPPRYLVRDFPNQLRLQTMRAP